MKDRLFRKVALERLSSPERLDELMQLTTPGGWLALVAWTYFDAATQYTGTPFAQTDGLGMTINGPFDHPDFPLVLAQ